MYQLYVDDKLTGTTYDFETVKSIGFVLAVKGHKVAYMRIKEVI